MKTLKKLSVSYTQNKKDFWAKQFGIEAISSKTTFAKTI